MFKFFKEKLQGLLKSTKEEPKEEIKPKKEKKATEKSIKKPLKKKEKPFKKEIEKTEEAIEEVVELVETKQEQETTEREEKIEKSIENTQEEIKDLEEKEQKVEKEKGSGFFGFFKKKEEKKKAEETEKHIEEEIDSIEKKIDEKEKDIEEDKGILSKIQSKFNTIKLNKEKFNEIFESLEYIMLESNVALSVVDKIREDMEKNLLDIEVKKSDLENEIKKTLRKSLEEILIEPFDLIKLIKSNNSEKPFVILFFGINGAGKTTSIAKMVNLLKENNLTSVLAAGDTFRAASIEQLEKHADNLNVKVIKQAYGADPSAVGFDAIKYAEAHGIKVVLIDTAGRMHTKTDLVREMEKIVRVTKPNLKIFVAEAITGNDATEQAKIFNEAIGIDGSILSKADVDERGGSSISIGYVTGKPILFLGVGQEYKDLEVFSSKKVIESLGLS